MTGRIRSIENPMTSAETEPATFWLVAYDDGKFKYTYTGCFFCMVVHTGYNISWFIQQVDFEVLSQHVSGGNEAVKVIVRLSAKKTNDLIGNQTCAIPACSIVP
jgi:hypothetical protein